MFAHCANTCKGVAKMSYESSLIFLRADASVMRGNGDEGQLRLGPDARPAHRAAENQG